MTASDRPDTEQISALAGGELGAVEAAAVQAAIDTDADLRADYRSLVAAADLLAATPKLRPPRDYVGSLPPVTIAPRWMRWTPTLLATAALALIAFALIDLQLSRSGPTDVTAAIVEAQIEMSAPSAPPEAEGGGMAAAAVAEGALDDVSAEDAAPREAPLTTESTDSAAAAPPVSRSAAAPVSAVPDPAPMFDPVWLAIMATGGALLLAAGFAYVFRPR